MEGLTRIVSESMARHGVDSPIDYRRLQWSRWFACNSSLDLILVPSSPGLFALAEEILSPADTAASGGKRMLAVLQLSHTEDLALTMSRWFAPDSPLRDRVAAGRLFARYTLVEDDSQRHAAHAAFQRWLTSSAEAASGISCEASEMASAPSPSAEPETPAEEAPAPADTPAPLPHGF